MGRRLFLDEPSALPELMISLIRDALAAVRRMRRMGPADPAGRVIQTLYAEFLNLS